MYLVIGITLIPSLRTDPLSSAIWLMLFIWCIGCTVMSYLLTAMAEPGRVPSTWRPTNWQSEEPATPGVEVNADECKTAVLYPLAPSEVISAGTAMLRGDGRFRFCAHCNVFKPDRAHHCSSCGECVLLMDHHCPFTGNSCVGLLNRKFFLLFLYYATLSCTLVATLTPRSLLNDVFSLEEPLQTRTFVRTILLVMGYVLCALHAIALLPFSVFHTYLVLVNRTTIENQETRHTLHLDVLRRSDRGLLANWKMTFGSSAWLWFVPVTYGRECDGLRWPSTAARSSNGSTPVIGDEAV